MNALIIFELSYLLYSLSICLCASLLCIWEFEHLHFLMHLTTIFTHTHTSHSQTHTYTSLIHVKTWRHAWCTCTWELTQSKQAYSTYKNNVIVVESPKSPIDFQNRGDIFKLQFWLRILVSRMPLLPKLEDIYQIYIFIAIPAFLFSYSFYWMCFFSKLDLLGVFITLYYARILNPMVQALHFVDLL